MNHPSKTIYLVASGDLRLSANQSCWPAQQAMELAFTKAVESLGCIVQRAHAFDSAKGHGLIDCQRMGIEVFASIPVDAPLVVAEAMWQYSHHVLAGLHTHQGPILTVANWSGQWPGLVGLLNLNGCLTKAGVAYSSLWSEDFSDGFFLNGLQQWLSSGAISHDTSHSKAFSGNGLTRQELDWARQWAIDFRKNKAIMGVFDEGCMGMYNAIVPDELLHELGIYKERLSQSALFAAMRLVKEEEAEAVVDWLLKEGMQFRWGQDEATELTKAQTLLQAKMYIAALRMATDFGCDTIGIQYQQGLKDICPASDLVEGLLNNVQRPPAFMPDGRECFAGAALPHFNEVDECAGIDALITNRLWAQLGLPVENTLHDLRWGRQYQDDVVDDFVWVLLISGAAPPAHFVGGYQGASSERQPAMYFPLGGGTCKGLSKPGHIVWSRIYVAEGLLCADLGVGESLALPEAETEDRWQQTTPQWPIMHARFLGISRDQMMAKHKANHIQVVYAGDAAQARHACLLKAAVLQGLGMQVNVCGTW